MFATLILYSTLHDIDNFQSSINRKLPSIQNNITVLEYMTLPVYLINLTPFFISHMVITSSVLPSSDLIKLMTSYV